MAKLVLTRGLPGSGKTTYAKRWASEGSGLRARVNRDDLREMLHGGPHGYVPELERRVTIAQEAQVFDMLKTGWDVIVDDMNLRNQYVRRWHKLAAEAGAEVEIVDFTNVPVGTCIDRDKSRFLQGHRHVGEKVIEDLYGRYVKGKPYPLPVTPWSHAPATPEPYVAPVGKPRAILVDIDGTVALMNGRGPFDWHRVGEDLPNAPVVKLVEMIDNYSGYQMEYGGPEVKIIFMSGRDEVCRDETTEWLRMQVGAYRPLLFMRPEGDNRKDSVVKLELFDAHIRDEYDVLFVLDDRDQVVEMWRSLGLTCLQVAPGNF